MKRLLVLLAACGAANKGAPSNRGGTEIARIGEGLVTAGKSWTYDVTAADGSHTTATCQVTAFAGADRRGEITCDDDFTAITGVWALTADGLHYLGSPADEVQDPSDQNLVLAATPKEGSVGTDMEDGALTTRTTRDGDAWCVEDDSGGEDGVSVRTTCFDEDGVLRGSDHVTIADAPAQDSRYTRR